MSDNPLMTPGAGANPLVSNANAQPAPATPAQPQMTQLTHDNIAHMVSGANRGRTQEQMVQRRDAAGVELDMLARIVNDPDPKPDEVTDYLVAQLKGGQLPAEDAVKLLNSMPKDPDMLRTWARNMFSVVMHIGIHAHAAFPREHFPSAAPEVTDAEGETDV